MSDYDIRIDKVTKYYGFNKVINDLDLEIATGEFFTIYGPNGAGKTTLLMILSTLVKPSGGQISIGDMSYVSDRDSIRRITGLVSHREFLYENLTAYENLKFFASLYDLKNIDDRILYLFDQLSLHDRRNDLVRNYSSGMKKRLSIARSIIHDPIIILFDEPFGGLDQKALSAFYEILLWLRNMKRTVIITTHNIKYAIDLCDRVAIMNKGRIDNIQGNVENFEQKVEDLYRNCIK